MDIPSELLVHTVTVEPFEGSGAYGETYGAANELACFAEGTRRLVRNSTGEQVVSSLTLYALPGLAAEVPVDSRITWGTTTTVVIASTERDDGGMGAPQHTEIVCE